MVQRKVIKIDEALCNGCGNCMAACAEGAVKLIDGKARVISDRFCDGLGACLSVCPTGALSIEEREAEEFHPEEVKAPSTTSPCTAPISFPSGSAPFGSAQPRRSPSVPSGLEGGSPSHPPSELSNWPIQLRLIQPNAPYLKGASLLIAADCTGFACPTVHQDFIQGRVSIVGCPKLDDQKQILERLTSILRLNDVSDITALYMTVPCCKALDNLVKDAVKRSGKSIPLKSYIVGIRGGVSEA